jgi:hypothetical protein
MSDTVVHQTAHQAVDDEGVLAAMAVTRRGCEELLPESEWLKKLVRSAATGPRLPLVEPGLVGRPRKDLVVAGRKLVGEVGLEQRFLHLQLFAL